MATGTIAACPRIAIRKPPFLKGSSAPVRLRVPSGKTMKESPPARAAAAASMARELCSRLRRSIGTNPTRSKALRSTGKNLRNSALYRIFSLGWMAVSAMKMMGGSRFDVWLTQ